jgi:hypothetical protein
MMHGREKSDPAIVAGKPTNKVASATAEPVEPRAGAERNAGQQSTHRTQGRECVSHGLDRVRQAARQRKKEKFTELLHHVDVDLLRESFFALKRKAAPGVDGLTWQAYAADLDRNLTDLHARVHRGAYRALPSRRTYIPKADGKRRPLAVGSAAFPRRTPGPNPRTANLGGKTFRQVGLGWRGNPGDHWCRPVPIQPRLR